MSNKKPVRCQVCGDAIKDAKKGKHICRDCQEHAAQPRMDTSLTATFVCVECGSTIILATGEYVAHRDRHRYCLDCWQKSPSRYRNSIEKKPIVPEWAIELGVDPPYTVEAAKRRFNELALTSHPDHGGDSAAFIRVRKYYEMALTHFDQQEFEVLL